MKALITGGCGFIGHHVVEHILKNTDWNIAVLDKLTYAAAGFDRLRDIKCFDDKRMQIFTADFTRLIPPGIIQEIGKVDYIFHLGAETHVDNSILDPEPFIRTNVLGTMQLLDYAKYQDPKPVFFYFSTDEVFGPAPPGILYKEEDRYNSGNPYAASKAGGEELCAAYANTYKLPVVITHTMNVYGERQHPEKYIPGTIRRVILGETVTVHADKTKTKAGSRFYIHARNVASALLFLIEKGITSGKHNIVGEKEVNNLDLAQIIASVIGKDLKYEMVDFHSSRPGHDLRYALDGSKMKRAGWTIPVCFNASLRKTIKWYLENPLWLGMDSK